jgi:hypothetical protein
MRNGILAIILIILLSFYAYWYSASYIYFQKELLFKWAADTRLYDNPYPIKTLHFNTIRNQLEPGDIILTRRNGYISNYFIPGYWTHSALYIGTTEVMYDKNQPFVIEALSEGITCRSIEESLQVDAFIVLRPLISKLEIEKAIKIAKNHLGKPYDFDFDFNTLDKVGCTELIFRSYRHAEVIAAHQSFGRKFTTPSEILEDFINREGSKSQRLDFVLQMNEKGELKVNNKNLIANQYFLTDSLDN